MSREDRKLICSAFTEAKKFLWKGDKFIGAEESDYICYAITKAVRHDNITYWQFSEARRVIMSRLGASGTVEQWLLAKGIKLKELTKKRVQSYRHEWLDKLILEYSK